MKDFYIMGHLGLGDHFLTNGIVRTYAENRPSIKIPCWHHNLETVTFMFEDLKNVSVIGVNDEPEAVLLCHKKECLRLGYYSKDKFDQNIFDQEFYRHAAVPFEDRWNKFKISEDFEIDEERPSFSIFVHDDESRRFKIDDNKLPKVHKEFIYRIKSKQKLREIIRYMSYCEEIHCINSSMLILADSIPTPNAKRLVFHKYSRPTIHPTLIKQWEII